MSLSKPVVNEVKHKEWYRREVMRTAFEARVCDSKHEGGRFDTKIESVRSIKSLIRRSRSNIVCSIRIF